MQREPVQSIAAPIELKQPAVWRLPVTLLLSVVSLIFIISAAVFYAGTLTYRFGLLHEDFYLFMLAGFIAQMIDGAQTLKIWCNFLSIAN